MSARASGWERLQALSPGRIDEVIGDLELLRSNARLFYAVDPYEIIDFSFPINPDQALDGEAVDIDVVADDQLALYEIFYASSELPLLLPEYAEELDGLHRYLIHFVNRVYQRADVLDSLVHYGALGEEEVGEGRGLEEVVDAVEESFNLILAVGLGIYAIGVDRFLDIIHKKLRKTLPGSRGSRFAPLDKQYKRSKRAWRLYEALQEHQRRQPWAERESDVARARRERADLRDATAVDRILTINAALEAAYLKPDRRVKRRIVILYLSAAQKTKFFFSLREVRRALPVINGKRYKIWRTRDQVFAQAAFRGKGRTRNERYGNTISRLKQLRRVVDEISALNRVFDSGRTSERCKQCVLTGGHGEDCSFLPHCERAERLSQHLEERKGELHNLGLVSTLNRYRRVTDLKPEKRSYDVYVSFIREVLGSKRVRDRALERMLLVHRVTMGKILFARTVSLTVALREVHIARSGRDAVTGALQYLPLRPKLDDPEYRSFAGEISRAVVQRGKNPENLVRVYDKFWERDVRPGTNRDHEVVRCLLYACSATKDGTGLAYEHARELWGMKGVGPVREFGYLLIWLGRRRQEFFFVDSLVSRLIAEFPDDERFYHGRGLNSYSWLSDKKASPLCPWTLRDVCGDFSRALSGYQEADPEDGEMVAALANNLAYIMVLRGEDEPECLEEAREFIDVAKAAQPKDTWAETFPEYLHTEALLEYREFLAGKEEMRDKDWLVAKLTYAKRDLSLAVEGFPKTQYRKLLESISRSLEELK